MYWRGCPISIRQVDEHRVVLPRRNSGQRAAVYWFKNEGDNVGAATTGAVARTTLSAWGDNSDVLEASVGLDTVSPFAVRDAAQRAKVVL